MTEEFLHYLWKFNNFDLRYLKTSDGESIHIIHGGIHNPNAGPDFENARIQIGDQIWAGHVEIHVKSSDWYQHGHQHDDAYQNVILHVVYSHDKSIFLEKDQKALPTLILGGRFSKELFTKYEAFLTNSLVIPCANQIKHVPNFVIDNMLDRVLIERLESKTNVLSTILNATKQDWNEAFYRWMTRGFGLKVNTASMLNLSERLPQKILSKHRDNHFQLEALLFGTAGMLNSRDDQYVNKLAQEYEFLKSKYNLEPMLPVNWKYSRIRPQGFPSLRIAQLASLWQVQENLFSKVLETGSIQKLYNLFDINVSEYWTNHYSFGKETKTFSGALGEDFIRRLISNVVVPFLFLYGKLKDQPFYHQRALDLLDQLPGENNAVSRKYMALNINNQSAYRSQATIQLHDNYCKLKKCLNCNIGIHLLKK